MRRLAEDQHFGRAGEGEAEAAADGEGEGDAAEDVAAATADAAEVEAAEGTEAADDKEEEGAKACKLTCEDAGHDAAATAGGDALISASEGDGIGS